MRTKPSPQSPKAVPGTTATFSSFSRVVANFLLDHQLLSLFRQLRPAPLCENQGQYPEVDQVGPVDSGKGPGDHRPHAQIGREQGRVLSAGALSVILPGQNHAAAVLQSPSIKSGVAADKGRLCRLRHVGAQGAVLRAGGRDRSAGRFTPSPAAMRGRNPLTGSCAGSWRKIWRIACDTSCTDHPGVWYNSLT